MLTLYEVITTYGVLGARWTWNPALILTTLSLWQQMNDEHAGGGFTASYQSLGLCLLRMSSWFGTSLWWLPVVWDTSGMPKPTEYWWSQKMWEANVTHQWSALSIEEFTFTAHTVRQWKQECTEVQVHWDSNTDNEGIITRGSHSRPFSTFVLISCLLYVRYVIWFSRIVQSF